MTFRSLVAAASPRAHLSLSLHRLLTPIVTRLMPAVFAVSLASSPSALAGDPEGACCLPDGSCAVRTEAACTADDGAWTNGGDCDTTGRCEVGGDCFVTTENCCDEVDGEFTSGGECDDDGCAILPGLNSASALLRPDINTLLSRIIATPASSARGTPQVFIDGSNILQIIGTPAVDRIRVWIDPSDSTRLEVQIPDDGSGLVVDFAIADFVRIAINTGDETDLVVFDDANGNVADVRPYDITTGDGDDIIIARTGALTLAQVQTLVATLDSARNLATQAEALMQAAGAVSGTGEGTTDLISAANLLAQSTNTLFISPTESYLTDLTNQLILPTANVVPDTLDDIITPALQQIDQAHVDLVLAAQQLANDAQTDLVDVGQQLANDAQTTLVTQAQTLEGCGVSGLLSTDAGAFISDMEDLMAQIQVLADLCPEKGPEPPEQPDGCPQVQELSDCAEALMEDFILRVEICEDLGNDLADDADDFLDRAEAELEGPSETYELQFENYESTADAFGDNAELYADNSELWIQSLESTLETAGAAFDQRAETEYVANSAVFEQAADSTLQNVADQLADDALTIRNDAQAIITACASLLNGPVRGGANGDCSQITTTNTITGGPGANFLLGSGANDLIRGLGGPDLIVGGPGDDILEGDDGIDLVFGGSDTNILRGGDGLDILIGGNDVDCIEGNDGFDIILAFSGNDTADGGAYIDLFIMDAGDDTATGRDGIDVMFGGGGADQLNGGDCIDVIFGQDGDDTIIGGDGQKLTIGSFSIELGDVLFGGLGNDTMYGDFQSRNGSGIDVAFGGLGNDVMALADGGDMVIGSFEIKLGNVAFGGEGNDEIESKKGICVLFGQNGDDTISSDEGAVLTFSSGNFELALGDLIFGGDGDDTIDSDTEDGTQDIDFVFAGAGNDTVRAYDGGMLTVNSFEFMLGNLVFGRAGDDAITTGAGLDVIFGGTENDTISAGDGADLEISTSFSIKLGDLLFAGDGNDVIHADVPDVADGVGDDGIDLIFCGPGDDQAYGAGGGTVVISSVDFIFGNLIFGGPGNDLLTGDYQTFDAGDLEEGIDLIFGATGDDTIIASPGDELLIGTIPSVFFINIGNIVFGGPDNDTITTVEGLDIVFCGRGDDNADTGDGIDFVFGSQGDDTLTVGDGGVIVIPTGVPPSTPIPLGNFVFGGDHNDTIVSQGRVTEIDLLFGNKCDDLIRAGNGLIDLTFGGPGNDEIRGGDGVLDLLFGGREDDIVRGGDGVLDLLFGGRDNDSIFGEGGIDLIFGNRENDFIDGGLSLDLCFGNRGNDTVRGGDGIDLVFGNRDGDDVYGDNGLDLVFGGQGADIVHGGSDLDLLFGGAENDVVYGDSGLTLGFGNGGDDRIYGGIDLDLLFGNSGNDVIDAGSNVDIVFGNGGNDTIFGGSGLNLLFGNSGQDYIVGGSDLDLIFGNSGNDLIYGGGSVDLLFGNSDSDTLYGESGGDLMFGNSGADDFDGGADRDFMFGNSDNDRMMLRDGNDFAFGNNNEDNIRATQSDGNNDYLFGNRGDDTLDRCESNDKRLGGPGSDNKTEDCTGFSFAGPPGCGEISGIVRFDPDAAGPAPAVPQAGITVYLDNNNNGVLDGEPSMVTAGDDPNTFGDDTGAYRFANLASGTYRVRQVLGATVTQLSPAGAHVVSLGTCQVETGRDFLNRDACQPAPTTPAQCEGCPCPPGFESRPVNKTSFVCSYGGNPCTTDADCECGGTCQPVQSVTCDCVAIDDCPQGSTPEIEPACGPTEINSGCDTLDGTGGFQPVHCGETICGTALRLSQPADIVDSDWYELSPSPVCTIATICARGDFRGRLEVRTPGCPGQLLAVVNILPTQEFCIQIDLVQARYLRVIPTDFTECANYSFSVACTPCAQTASDADAPAGDPAPKAAPKEIDDEAELRKATRGAPAPLPNTPLIPAPPHDARKNRYVSIVPNNLGVTAIEITIPPCRRAWVGEPVLVDFNGQDPAFVCEVVANPVFRSWTEDVIHIRGCVIAPQKTYELRGVNMDDVKSDPLLRSTVDVWGDVAGTPVSGVYTPPDGVVNQVDLRAVQEGRDLSPNAPHTTWVDLGPLDPDYFIDNIDVNLVTAAIGGQTYPPPQFDILDIVECELAATCAGLCADSTCDGYVTVSDIGYFVTALTQGEQAWRARFKDSEPSCSFLCANDMNGDGAVTVSDIGPFVRSVVQGRCTRQ